MLVSIKREINDKNISTVFWLPLTNLCTDTKTYVQTQLYLCTDTGTCVVVRTHRAMHGQTKLCEEAQSYAWTHKTL